MYCRLHFQCNPPPFPGDGKPRLQMTSALLHHFRLWKNLHVNIHSLANAAAKHIFLLLDIKHASRPLLLKIKPVCLICNKDDLAMKTLANLTRKSMLKTRVFPNYRNMIRIIWFCIVLTANICSLHENQHYHVWSSMVYVKQTICCVGCYCFHT